MRKAGGNRGAPQSSGGTERAGAWGGRPGGEEAPGAGRGGWGMEGGGTVMRGGRAEAGVCCAVCKPERERELAPMLPSGGSGLSRALVAVLPPVINPQSWRDTGCPHRDVFPTAPTTTHTRLLPSSLSFFLGNKERGAGGPRLQEG